MFTKNITDDGKRIRHAIHSSYTVPLATFSGTDQRRIIVVPPASQIPLGAKFVLDGVSIVTEDTIAAHDTNYWSAQITNLTRTLNLLSAEKTSKITGGEAITADVPWLLTPNQNTELNPNDVIELVMTKAASAGNITEGTATIYWHWE